MNKHLANVQSNWGISATLAIAFITLSVLVLLISTGLQIFSNAQAQSEANSTRQRLIAQDAARTVSSFIQERKGVLDTVARVIDPTVTSKAEQERVLSMMLSLQPSFRQLVVLDNQEQQTAGVSRLSGANSLKIADKLSPAVFEQLKQGNDFISPVYIDPNTSEPLIVMALPVTNAYGDVQGTLLVEVNLKFMWELMDQVKVGQTGYAYVIDDKGTLLAFEDISRVLQGENLSSIPTVARFVNQPSVTTAPVETYPGINGKLVAGTYVPLGTPPWAVVTELPYQEANQGVIQQIIWSFVIAISLATVAGFAGAYLARRIAVPLVKLMETANRISGGELDVQVSILGPKEIMGLANAFNSMTTRLRNLLQGEKEQRQRLQDTVRSYNEHMQQVAEGNLSDRVAVAQDSADDDDPLILLGQQLNQMTDSLRGMIQQIREAANDLNSASAEILSATAQQASSASEQSAAITQTTTTVEEVKTIAENNSQRSKEVANEAQQTRQVSLQGKQAVQETIESMNQIKVRVHNIAENVLTLSHQAKQIGQIVSTVNDLAAQSNMLALNASIEAARAGEHGKGFAVVAGEVRTLANQSKNATSQVKTILDDIQKAINTTAMVTEEGIERVESGMQRSVQSNESIERLANAIDQSAQIAAQVMAGGQQQQTGIEQIAQAMQNISQATYQGMISTRQAEQSARNLNELARRLSETVTQYRV